MSYQDTSEETEKTRKKINQAYAILSNPDKRAEYDRERVNLKGKVIGDFRVLEFIDEAATTEVYTGEHLLLGEPVCIKHCSRVSSLGEAILVDEAKALWGLSHYSLPAIRNILKLEDGTTALVMSYIAGPTWAQIIEKNGAMHPEHVTWLAQRILNALRYLHLHGHTIHGDIKPQKIIVHPNIVMAVLVGFGFSIKSPTDESRSKGYSGLFSPLEAIQGMPLLPASDFFGLGMTMVYALNGDEEETKKRNVPESTPEPLCDFVKKLIAVDILERPSWEDENLVDELEEVKIKSFGKKSKIKPIPW